MTLPIPYIGVGSLRLGQTRAATEFAFSSSHDSNGRCSWRGGVGLSTPIKFSDPFPDLSPGYRRGVDRGERLKENEKLFKLANERLEQVVAERLDAAQRVPFLCECADETCMGQIDLTLDDYHEVRANPDYFVMVTDHTRSPGEAVVARRDGYDITQKPD